MLLTPINSPVHAPEAYVELYGKFITLLGDEIGLLNQVRHSYEGMPVGKTLSVQRLDLLQLIKKSHLERAKLIEQLIKAEFDLLEFKPESYENKTDSLIADPVDPERAAGAVN
jgi:hypothetical protein